ncbi:MAG TPA: hypothetical protein VFS00_13865 [Polyangiaceae bacterium]|nr:hypothetical protein [Polyangiaceae bacterium]
MTTRPVLHIHVEEVRPGLWTGTAHLPTAQGPIALSVTVPAALLAQYVKLAVGLDEAAEVGGFLDKLRKKATRFVSGEVVKRALDVIKTTTLPAHVERIGRAVQGVTGLRPTPAHVAQAFDVASRALRGDKRAKAQLRSLMRGAGKSPALRAAMMTVQHVAPLLPKIRPVVRAAAAAVPGLAQGLSAVEAADALRRGDWQALARAGLSAVPGAAPVVQAAQAAHAVRAAVQGEPVPPAALALPGPPAPAPAAAWPTPSWPHPAPGLWPGWPTP